MYYCKVYVQQGVEQARQEAKSIQMTGFAGKAPVYSLGNLGSCPCLATENGTDKLTTGRSSCFWLLWISVLWLLVSAGIAEPSIGL